MHLNLKIEHDQITVKNKKLHSSLVEAEEKLSQALQVLSSYYLCIVLILFIKCLFFVFLNFCYWVLTKNACRTVKLVCF